MAGLKLSIHRIRIDFLHLFTFQPPIIYDNSALQAELLIYKGDLSVKSNSYLITFKDADPQSAKGA